jgi:putative DNA methylase
MLDMEARGNPKVADFQNFAKSFAFADYASLMGSTAANAASLAGAALLKGKPLRDPALARQPLFQLLFAVWKTVEKNDPRVGVTHIRTELGADYWSRRTALAELADYVAAKTGQTRPEESAAAAELAEALRVDRI